MACTLASCICQAPAAREPATPLLHAARICQPEERTNRLRRFHRRPRKGAHVVAFTLEHIDVPRDFGDFDLNFAEVLILGVRSFRMKRTRFGRTSKLEMLDPAGLAHMFLVKTAQARGHDAGPAQIANHSPGIAALHDRQATNIVAQHLGGSLV